MSNITRRGDSGLGQTANGGNEGSFAPHGRSATDPPPQPDSSPDVDEFGRPPMDLRQAQELLLAELREGDEDDSTDEELLVHAANTVSFQSTPGAFEFEDYGDESSKAWKVFLEHVDRIGVAEYIRQHPKPMPHERQVIHALAAENVQIDTAVLREAAERNSLLDSDLQIIRTEWPSDGHAPLPYAAAPQRAQRALRGAVMRAEAPARIAAAGIEYPGDWDDMSGSSKDLWEERVLRQLDRKEGRS